MQWQRTTVRKVGPACSSLPASPAQLAWIRSASLFETTGNHLSYLTCEQSPSQET